MTRRVSRVGFAAAVLALTACSPTTTTGAYDASDGVRADLGGGVHASNLMIISGDDGGILLGAIANDSAADTAVTVLIGDTTATQHTVHAGSAIFFSPDQTELRVDDVEADPGSWVDIGLRTPNGATTVVSVPVLDDSLPEYSGLLD